MPQNSGLSRYDHFKAIFSRHSSQEPEIKGDTTSETTLVPRQTQPTRYNKRDLPKNYNVTNHANLLGIRKY
ncbi:hypothetical protein N7537_002268 [Penicillium hordei]|uniref:Uncharacterized protein n=1 Tax=Penicillium hordei TaxID=40994 RepID=A0AAD6EI79_9EURO|nr:uncharacterized protein N7537_002268 [Penicillium hordei]KAJ5617154.1 hypothetical protein N7537_002268 [Penicillium hordei]